MVTVEYEDSFNFGIPAQQVRDGNRNVSCANPVSRRCTTYLNSGIKSAAPDAGGKNCSYTQAL